MTNYTKWMIVLVVLMFAITVKVVWTIHERFFEPAELTIQEAVEKIEGIYGGTVDSFKQKGNIFYLALNRSSGTYDLQIDRNTGDVIKIEQVAVSAVENKPADLKSKEEIRHLLKSKGTIQSILLEDGVEPIYRVKISKNQSINTATVNAKTGEVISWSTEEQILNNTQNSTVLSLKEAEQIALSQLSGTVDSAIFEDSDDGGYYLIEIETSTQEAVFQIHAISGNILSVTHQHDDDDELDEDDIKDNEDD